MKKNVQNLKMFALALGLMLCVAGVNAQTRTATTDGDWNSVATWGGLSVPTAANPVVIPTNINVDVINADAECASITFTGTGGDIDVSSGRTLNVTGAIVFPNGTSGSRSNSLIGGGTINCASLQVSGTTENLNGDGTITFTSTVGNLNISGDLSLFGEDDGFDDINATLNIPAGTVSIGGSLIINEENGSGVTVDMDGIAPETGTLEFLGNDPIVNVAGSATYDLDGSGATVRYAGGTQEVLNATYRNLTLDGTNINTSIKSLGGNISVTGNFLVTANASVDLGTSDITVSGSGNSATIVGRVVISNSGGVLSGTGTGTQTLILGVPGELYLRGNSTVLPSFDAYSFASNSVVFYCSDNNQTISSATVYGNLVTGDHGFGAGNGTGTKTISNNIEVINSLVIGQNTTLASNISGTGTITVGGTWLNAGTFSPSNDQVVFDGTSTQDLRGPSLTTFANLRVNKVDPEFGIRLDGTDAVVTGVVTFSNGFIGATGNEVLIFNAGASHTGANDNSKATCAVRKIGNTAFTFPVGKGDIYSPLTITAPDNASDALQAEYRREAASLLGPVATGIGITNVSFCEYWTLDEIVDAGGATSVDITVTWDGQSPCNGTGYITNIAGLTLAHFNGTEWDTHGGTATGTPASGSITRTGVNTFSPFSLANTLSGENPLPVKFSNIKAYEKQAGIQLDWISYQEVNVDNYVVERSADGVNFSMIGTVAALNSSNDTHYGYFDASPLAGTSFYRIRNVDLDGKSGFSNIVRVSLDKSVKDIRMYPNPVRNGSVSLQSADLARGNYAVTVYNAAGQQVTSRQFNHNGGSINQTISLPANTQSGMYLLELKNDGVRVMSKTFIVQQ